MKSEQETLKKLLEDEIMELLGVNKLQTLPGELKITDTELKELDRWRKK